MEHPPSHWRSDGDATDAVPDQYSEGETYANRDPYVEQPQPAQPKAPLRALGGVLLALGLFGLKFGKIAFVAVKGAKFFATSASMLVSIAAYTVIFGLPFAAGFVLLLLVHELGHAWQLKREGIASGAPIFIPFLGAAIAMKELPKDAAMEARVGLAGPIVGSAGALVTYAAALVTGSDLLQALAFTAFFLNLFNLLPVSPLDGGRAMAAVSTKAWLFGLVVLVGLVVTRPNPILILIAVLAAWETWGRWRRRHEEAEYYAQVTPSQRLAFFATWLGLVVGLAFLMDVSHLERSL